MNMHVCSLWHAQHARTLSTPHLTSPHHTTLIIVNGRQQSVPLPELGSTAAPLPAAVRAALRLRSRGRSLLLRGVHKTARQRYWPKRIPLRLDVRTDIMLDLRLWTSIYFRNGSWIQHLIAGCSVLMFNSVSLLFYWSTPRLFLLPAAIQCSSIIR